MNKLSRRDFVKTTAFGLGASSALGAVPTFAWAQGSDLIRVGLIGCGGRGTGAANDIVTGAEGVEIVAMGDLFPDRLEKSKTQLAQAIGPKLKVADRAFTGFDAYRRVIQSGVDLVILATPPGFRPAHFAAAVDAGKHVFMEKPVAVDPVGVRSVLAASDLAAAKG